MRIALLLLVLTFGCRTPRDSLMTEPSQDIGRAVTGSGSVEQSVVDRTNAERKAAGLRPLVENPQLSEAARRHAAEMARRNELSHTLDGKTAADRVRSVGYEYRNIGENIAWNQPTPKKAVDDWMTSRGHRQNLLGDFTQIGVGMAVNSKGEPYWVQVFGTPR